MKKKIKWIILVAIIIIVAILAFFIIQNENAINYTLDEISEYNYFVLTQNKKCGVIDKKGNIVIEPNYVAIQIPNPSKPVFVCINNYDEETKTYESTVYNEKNEQILKEYSNIQAIPIDTNIDVNPYEKSTLIYKKDGKYGLINLEGKELTKPIYDSISSINYKEGSFTVKQGDKVGVVNMKGKVIIPCEYETITSDNYYINLNQNKETGFIVSKKTENGYRYGYINYRGSIILEPQYLELERVTEIKNENDIYFIAFQNGQAGLLKNKEIILNYQYEDIQYNALNNIFIVQRNGRQGVIRPDGTSILPIEYDSILFGGMYLNAIKAEESFMFDLNGNQIKTSMISISKTENPNYNIAIDKNDIYTIIDKDGNTILDNNYSYIEYLSGDYFIVARDGKNGIIDITGKSIVDLKYTSIFRLNDTNLIQAEIVESNTIDLYNLKMERIASMENAVLSEHEANSLDFKKYIMLASENDFLYYDPNGNRIEAKTIFTNNSLFATKVENKWGFSDKNGDIKIDATYDMVTDFNEYGFAGIKKDGKWGVINKDGTIVQEPIYELNWIQPSFLGKYYRINAWYGDIRFSAESGKE